jgi:hypothetical protein
MATGRVPTTANSPLTAKGDLFGYSTAPARLAVGNDGEQIVADSSTSTGLRYNANFAAGKNKIINGDFGIWQRGTSLTNNTSFSYAFTADRFMVANNNGGTIVTSRQSFTPGTAPVAGYEGQYFFRTNATVVGSGNRYLIHPIENVQTFAGQTVTFSFWAKANTSLLTGTSALYFDQNFGSGGSGSVGTSIPSASFTVTTSWQRFSFTVAIPSISGKTIGTGSHLDIVWNLPDTLSTFTLDLWGWQLEAGSVATAFQTATGTLQGELAACQRYYYAHVSGTSKMFANANALSATFAQGYIQFPVTMRTTPTTACTSGTDYYDFNRNGGDDLFNSLTVYLASTTGTTLYNSTEIASTAGHGGLFLTNNASAFVAFTAEL